MAHILRTAGIMGSVHHLQIYITVKHNVPSSPILVTLMMEALRSSETLVLTTATRNNIPQDEILQETILLSKTAKTNRFPVCTAQT
jgi:hypothetical protein